MGDELGRLLREEGQGASEETGQESGLYDDSENDGESQDVESGGISPEMIRALFEGTCVLTFAFPDGSLVESVATLNQDTLEMHGLGQLDGIIDLQERRPIPEYMFEMLTGIRKGDEKHLSRLDQFFEIGGKIGW